MKTTLRLRFGALLTAFAVFGLTNFAYANEPAVVIDYLQVDEIQYPPGSSIILPSIPYDTTIVGRVSHDGPGKLNVVELSAYVNFKEIYRERQSGSGNATEAEYRVPWTIESYGGFFIEIIASKLVKGSPQNCKAAPALAAAYVRENPHLFEPGVIAKVGKETGINGELSAKRKCEFDYFVKTIDLLTH